MAITCPGRSSPLSVASSRSSALPAGDTTPLPSALTLTRPLPLRFTQGVPSCEGLSIIQRFDSASQAGHFFVSQHRVDPPGVKHRGLTVARRACGAPLTPGASTDSNGDSQSLVTDTRQHPVALGPDQRNRQAVTPLADSRRLTRPRHRAISGPLTPVRKGLSRSLMDNPPRRSRPLAARMEQIPKLIVRVRFPSPAPGKPRSEVGDD
jgi:hypothetical protein